jgi:hypothetical protein
VIDPRSFVVVQDGGERYPKRQRHEKMMWWRGERVTYARDKSAPVAADDVAAGTFHVGKEMPVPVYKEPPFPSAQKFRRAAAERARTFGKLAAQRRRALAKRKAKQAGGGNDQDDDDDDDDAAAAKRGELGFDDADLELMAEARRAAAEDVDVADMPQDVVVALGTRPVVARHAPPCVNL